MSESLKCFNETHWKLRQSEEFVGVTVRSVWDTECVSGTLKSRWQNVFWEAVICVWVIQIYRNRKPCWKFGHFVLPNILIKREKDHHMYVVHTAEHIMRNGRLQTYHFEWNCVFLELAKRQYSKALCYWKFQCINSQAISLCYNPEFNGDSLDAVLCPGSFCKGNIFRKLFLFS